MTFAFNAVDLDWNLYIGAVSDQMRLPAFIEDLLLKVRFQTAKQAPQLVLLLRGFVSVVALDTVARLCTAVAPIVRVGGHGLGGALGHGRQYWR